LSEISPTHFSIFFIFILYCFSHHSTPLNDEITNKMLNCPPKCYHSQNKILLYIHTYIHTRTDRHIHRQTHTYIHNTYIYTHTYTYTYTHTHTYTHIHRYIHTSREQ
ncbi:hypothetical protein LOAG_04397, partial [Loa loa]